MHNYAGVGPHVYSDVKEDVLKSDGYEVSACEMHTPEVSVWLATVTVVFVSSVIKTTPIS